MCKVFYFSSQVTEGDGNKIIYLQVLEDRTAPITTNRDIMGSL